MRLQKAEEQAVQTEGGGVEPKKTCQAGIYRRRAAAGGQRQQADAGKAESGADYGEVRTGRSVSALPP